MIAAKDLTQASEQTPPTRAVSFAFTSDIVVLSEPNSAGAEALRTLRTRVMAQHIDDGRRGLAVCSPEANVGATFTAVNLAISLAQIGVKTLLIDADMRNPTVDRLIVPSHKVSGLSQYLASEELEVSSCIQNDVLENLSVVFSGGATPDAQELLGGERFAHFIARCLRDFDVTVIDTPPANSCADARRISTVVGYSVIVARRHQTYVGDVKALAAQLKDDRAIVVGSVMNEG